MSKIEKQAETNRSVFPTRSPPHTFLFRDAARRYGSLRSQSILTIRILQASRFAIIKGIPIVMLSSR